MAWEGPEEDLKDAKVYVARADHEGGKFPGKMVDPERTYIVFPYPGGFLFLFMYINALLSYHYHQSRH